MRRLLLPLIIVCLSYINTFAGIPTADGLDADVYSISIIPDTATVGAHPEIIGYIQNKSSPHGKNENKAFFSVRAAVSLPNKSQKVWWWDNVSFLPSQKKSYSLVKSYDISKPGAYKIEYSIYNTTKTRLISSLSKTFLVKDAVVKAPPPVSTAKGTAEPVKTVTTPYTVAAPKPVVVSKTETPKLPPRKTVVSQPPTTPAARRYIGIGGYANTLNFSGGPTLILWPLKNLAIQGSYGWGTFTSYEIRGFYRFNMSPMLKPYLGVGYLHAEREFKITSSGNTLIEGAIKGNSYTVFGGVEVSLIKDRLALYVDVSGTPLKLEDDVMIGANKVKVSVDYSPVTVGTGLVFYIW